MSMDCAKLTDVELSEVWRDVNAELSRRQAVAAIPRQVARMTTEYVAGGGDRADLTEAVEDAPEPSEKTSPPSSTSSSTGTSSGSGPTAGVGVKVG